MKHFDRPQSEHIMRPPGLPRRTMPRVNVNRRAVIALPKSGRPHPVLLRNISIAGACVSTDARLALGDDVRLCSAIADGAKLILNAIVVGIRPHRQGFFTDYGLRFMAGNNACMPALEAFVRSRSK